MPLPMVVHYKNVKYTRRCRLHLYVFRLPVLTPTDLLHTYLLQGQLIGEPIYSFYNIMYSRYFSISFLRKKVLTYYILVIELKLRFVDG